MIVQLMVPKIISLFLMIFLGFLLVRKKILKSSDSRVLSILGVYLIMPCMILSAFQMDYTDELKDGLLLAFLTAFLINIAYVFMISLCSKIFHFSAVEKLSIIYPNCGNFTVPLVAAMIGNEWVIYGIANVIVQHFFVWSYGVSVIRGEKHINLKKVVTNTSIIAFVIGAALFLLHIPMPSVAVDLIDTLSGMMGPYAMLTVGMLLAGMNLKDMLRNPRLCLVSAFRLLVFPLMTLVMLKYTGLASLAENGENILLIVLLAASAPAASVVTSLSLVYDSDAAYAGVINVVTTLFCIVTMPVMAVLYQI